MEKVLAINTQAVNEQLNGKKVLTLSQSEALLNQIYAQHVFIPRKEAEKDTRFKQIIPYIYICHEDKRLLFQRLGAQTETRLHGMYSLGLGGHINPEDGQEGDVIEAGLFRELEEEITVNMDGKPKFMGLINDDSTEVGLYHLGLVFQVRCKDLFFEINEKEKMRGQWATHAEIQQKYQQLETWSRLLFDYFL